MPAVQYKVNIYAIIEESVDVSIESKELHEKVILLDDVLHLYTEEMERMSAMSGDKLL